MITLYHGSNVEIDQIDLNRCRPGKDFGQGFYLNPNFSQAYDMAEKTTRILRRGTEIVTAFDFDDSVLNYPENLKIKVFPNYSNEWADFVVRNRKNQTQSQIHDYDIVIGPIADDSVGTQIRRFIEGYMSVEQLVEELIFHGDRAIQYYFGTERAIKLLKHKENE